jgi:thiamine-monophosphate kinase
MTIPEFDIINTYFNKSMDANSNVILGIGDDAAIVSVPDDQELILSIDTLISGVHFPADTAPADIAHKALAVNLSDLAAMGATPKWVTLALTLPDAKEKWLREFSDGFFALANRYNVKLIGGDLTRGPLSMSIQAQGFIPKGLALRRDGAQPGDLIYVTNTLGDAGFALQHYQQKALPQTMLDKFYRPEPRIHIGEKLRGIANAAIDISDGLAADLGHILKRSNVGATINVATLPLSEAILASLERDEAIQLALTAGDDYELCFTVPENKTDELTQVMQNEFYTCVGTITSTKKLDLHFDNGKKYVLKTAGYQHF